MVFAGCKLVNRKVYFAQIEWHTIEHHVAFRQGILAVELREIEVVIGGRHPCRILVPIEQIERHWLLAKHVVVHDVRPDQIARAKHVEHVGHAGAVQITFLGHDGLDGLQLLVADQQCEIAGLREISLRREESR